MEALRASYGDSSSDSDTDDLSPAGTITENSSEKSTARKQEKDSISLPPPPLALLDSIVSTGDDAHELSLSLFLNLILTLITYL